jgi:hypothetical protein
MLHGVRALDAVTIQPGGDAAQACARQELGDDPPHNGGLIRVGTQLPVHHPVTVWSLLQPQPLAAIACMPLLHSPRDVVSLGTGLLGQDGEDLPCTGLGGVKALANEDHPAAHLLELIKDHPDMGHAPA